MSKKLILIVSFYTLLQALDVNSSTEITLQVVTEPQFLTIEQQAEQNKPKHRLQGAITIFVRRLVEESNSQFSLSVLPWKRAMHYASTQPNTLIYPIARTEERENKFLWIGKIVNVKYYFYQLKDREDIKINSLKDAKELTLGLIGSYPLENYLLKNGFSNLEYVSDDYQSLKMLLSNRIDIFPKSSIGLLSLCIELEYNCNKLKPAFEIKDKRSDIYLAVSKGTNPELVKRLKNSYSKLVESGVYDELLGSISFNRQ